MCVIQIDATLGLFVGAVDNQVPARVDASGAALVAVAPPVPRAKMQIRRIRYFDFAGASSFAFAIPQRSTHEVWLR